MEFKFSKILITLNLLFTFAFCDIFSSTSHLKSLMYLERHMITTLNECLQKVDKKLNEIRNYIDEFSRTAGRPEFRGTDSSDVIIGNPIQAYQLVKRLSVDWANVQKMMANDDWKNVNDLVNEYKELFPDKQDLKGAALALVRLTDTYKLNLSEMTTGNISGLKTKIELTARDCLYLGKHSFNNGYYGQAIEWFQQALNKSYKEGNRTASTEEILPFYNIALEIHEDLWPVFVTNVTRIGNNSQPPHSMRFVDGDDDDFRNYQALCRGEEFRKPNDTKNLKCIYTDLNRKWLKLQPIKIEILNYKPYIAMFHDILSDKESSTIKQMAAPELNRAKVQTENTDTEQVSDTRISQTAWFSDDHEIISRLSLRISEATGLSTSMQDSHSELMQVANYGMGGHYTPHYDYLIVDRPPEKRHLVPPLEAYAGDRTATFMFYLSDVAKGGGTAFPRLGVTIKPKKNSAAFWYNLYRNGEGIIDTVHGACPVLLGEKWVANLWIRELGQAFRRKCSLNPEE